MSELLFRDRVYGRFSVTDPLKLVLINSPSVQRLEGINQLGVPEEFHSLGVRCYSRFDHSIGTMRLLELMGAGRKEQIAALLHDVSHYAFSHIADWVLEDYSLPYPQEDLQDKRHADFLKKSEIPEILLGYGINPKTIIDYKKFTLLEREIPDLCADRVDYSLRELPKDQARRILAGLCSKKGKIVCKDFNIAGEYARAFLRLQKEEWGSREIISRYTHFSNILKRALMLQIISHSDFLLDDNHIMDKLKSSSDTVIQKTLYYMRESHPLPAPKKGWRMHKKFRYIDPLFLDGKCLRRLSKVESEFKKLLDEARLANQRGVLVGEIP